MTTLTQPHRKGSYFKCAISIGLIALLSACGSGSGDSESFSTGSGLSAANYASEPMCQADNMKQWVDDNMRDYYLFFDQVPQVQLSDYDSPENLIKALRVQPFDRFSYVSDEAQSTAFFEEGIQFGFGWSLSRTSATDVQFLMVFPNSPLDAQGVKRGDYLLAIDGIDVNEITNAQLDASLGTGNLVVSPTLTVQTPDGSVRDIRVTKSEFKLQTVLDRSVTHTSTQSIAYLNFISFLETSSAEIDEAFDYFVQEQATELVLDLRYNGGGRISVARDLASKIVGNSVNNLPFVQYVLNNKYSQYNDSMNFEPTNNALNLSRVFVLTSSGTCSASEMVINGLRPFMEVITVGDTSCGKPYGTRPVARCGKVMNALEFEFQNAGGFGGYYEGLTADCSASDYPINEQGTLQDNLYTAALGYMNTGSCQLLASNHTRSRSNVAQFNPMLDEKAGIVKP